MKTLISVLVFACVFGMCLFFAQLLADKKEHTITTDTTANCMIGVYNAELGYSYLNCKCDTQNGKMFVTMPVDTLIYYLDYAKK